MTPTFRGVAAGKDQRPRTPGELGERLFEFLVRLGMAADQVRRPRPHAPAFDGRLTAVATR